MKSELDYTQSVFILNNRYYRATKEIEIIIYFYKKNHLRNTDKNPQIENQTNILPLSSDAKL